MRNKEIKGISIIIFAIIAFVILLNNKNSDFYSIGYRNSDFRQVYLEKYSGDSSTLLYYVDKGDDTVKCFTKGPISVESVDDNTIYTIDLNYSANDSTTVFKVFASDYISDDNSGGMVFINENLNPERSVINTHFVLDQPVDSLFITFETKDEKFSVNHLSMKSDKTIFKDTYILMLIVFVVSVVLLFFFNKKYLNSDEFYINEKAFGYNKYVMLFIFIAAITVFVACLPIIDGGIIYGHDTEFHMARIEGLARGLYSGQFPVRIHGGSLNDYGYPTSLFYPELLLYIPAVLRLFGVSIYTAFKLYIVQVNILGFIACYLPFKKFTQSRPLALMMTIVYLLSPGRLINAYYRCAIGELTAMTFLPLVIYGLYAVVYGNKKDWKYLVVGATLILQSHILSTEITVLFAVLFVMLGLKQLFNKERRIISLIVAAVFTVLINAWFIFPMIMMMLQLGIAVFERQALTTEFASTDVSFLFSISKFDTASLKGPYAIGFAVLIGVASYCVLRILYADIENNNKYFSSADNMLTNIALFTFASTAYFPWKHVGNIPLIGNMVNSIQFPHRLNNITTVLGVFIIGYTAIILCKNSKNRIAFATVFVCISMFSAMLLTDQIIGIGKSEIQTKSDYQNNMDNQLSVGQAEYLIAGNNIDYMIAHPPVLESENSTMEIANFKHWGTKLSFDYKMDITNESDVIVLPITYIPNYIIEVDGQRVYPTKTLDARVAFSVPYEKGSVKVHYAEPLTFRLWEAVSVVSLAAFVFICSDKGKKFFDKIIKQ